MSKLLLHVGCGKRIHEGFVNTDKDEMDITKPWPYEDESVDGIISMVVFQCIIWIDLYFALQEAYRVLKKGGVMRFGVVLEETKQPLRRFLFGRNIQIFNFELFRSVLVERIGFSSIKLCKFRETAVPEFIPVDCRHNRGTSYIEVIK